MKGEPGIGCGLDPDAGVRLDNGAGRRVAAPPLHFGGCHRRVTQSHRPCATRGCEPAPCASDQRKSAPKGGVICRRKVCVRRRRANSNQHRHNGDRAKKCEPVHLHWVTARVDSKSGFGLRRPAARNTAPCHHGNRSAALKKFRDLAFGLSSRLKITADGRLGRMRSGHSHPTSAPGE